MLGRRWICYACASLYGCGELDIRRKIVSATYKELRDPASIIKARGLYAGVVQLSPMGKMLFSTNVLPKFTTINGGIHRSTVGKLIGWGRRLNGTA